MIRFILLLALAVSSGASECLNIDVHTLGAVGDGATDDTAAFQAAFNLAISNSPQSAIVTVHSGLTYLIAGPTQPNGNAQIVIPPSSASPGGSQTIRIASSAFPAQSMSLLNGNWANFGGTVLKSTATSGAVIGTYGTEYEGFNPVTVDIENLTISVPDNPQCSGINLRKAFAVRIRGVTVCTGRSPATVIQPTSAESFGIATPTNNNGALTVVSETAVSGFYTGLELNEHTTGDNVTAWSCVQGVTFPFAYHASHLDRLMTVHCTKGIVFTGVHRVVIDQYDTERVLSGWNATIADVSDPGNVGAANLTWAAVTANVGVSHTFTASGSNVVTREIGAGFVAAPPPPGPTNLMASLPAVLEGLYVSYDAQCVTTGSTNRWVDLWTNALHLTAVTPASSVANDLNGYTSLSFTGTSGGPWYSNSLYSVDQPNEAFIVAKIGGNYTDYGCLIDSTNNASNRQFFAYNAHTGQSSFGAGTEVFGPAMPTNWVVFDVIYNGNGSAVYVNSSLFFFGNAGANSGHGLVVGAIPGYAPKTIAKIARIDAYKGVLDAASRSNQLAWAASRYGISP